MNIHCSKTSISIKNRLKEQTQPVSVIKMAASYVNHMIMWGLAAARYSMLGYIA
ncbi:hypothetical protein Pcaca05_24730 [Pectobacterium carotovorum subsp. carotovorum]|nr:hypothetical protein Pcaca05_24730 [Pectobacterium carotovorum subsp. carotovorum]